MFRADDVYVHVALLAFSPKEPGRQSTGAADPAGQLVPAGQMTHSSKLDMKVSDALACVP